jgi:hypothetical protein
MTSEKKRHAIASFKLDGKWRYFNITAQTCWSENKGLTLIKDEWDMYEGGDEYKAAFLNKSGITYAPDYHDNRGYSDEIASRVFSTDPEKISQGSGDYVESESWDIADIEYIKETARPRVKAQGKKSSILLTVRKPSELATRITSYEIQYRQPGKKKWSKMKTVGYKAKKNVALKNLEKNKKYDVRVRAVKTIGGVKYRCAWTKANAKTK